jgi:hypothetical protein
MLKNLPDINYPVLDTRAVNRYVFYPRGGEPIPASTDRIKTILIPVDENVAVGGRCHIAHQDAPNILYFHGNGEIVSDYDDFAFHFLDLGYNFIPVDYRGYGFSSGSPSVATMMKDSHTIFRYTIDWLRDGKMFGPLLIMGRSLGSASALEIASHYEDVVGGLILDSGFAYTGPLLQILGLNPEIIGFREEDGFQNRDKIGRFHKPTLIIHGENDEIIDVMEGRKLYESCPSETKRLLVIPRAGHNDLFALGLDAYLESLAWIKGTLI